jgi:leucyl-tRNA synthetase
VSGFLGRAWRMIVDERATDMQLSAAVVDQQATTEQLRVLHKTIKAVTEDVAKLSFNTAIARMMEFTNFFTRETHRPREVMRQFVLLLSPFAPHIAEELWEVLGGAETLAYEPWPAYDEALLAEETVELPVQINGKVRSRLRLPAEASAAEAEQAALADPRIVELLAGKQLLKAVVVPGRMVNLVIKP